MTLSSLPLSYCTNVHPGQSVAQVEAGLDRYAVAVRERFGHPLAAGLWLAEPVVRELLASAGSLDRFAAGLSERGLTCHTLNAFPFGDFHERRVKENVYLPDWTQPPRLRYTLDCAKVLARLLPEGIEGSISTVPLAFKGFAHPADFLARACDQLVACAAALKNLHGQTGKMIRLAVEPEPLCVLETTAEAIGFFQRLRERARVSGAAEADLRQHVGLCFDVCHQSVEFEDVAASIGQLARADVRINKVHISCALRCPNPLHDPDAREALRRYIEPRYLHQTLARTPDGRLARATDLNEQLIVNPDNDFASAPEWRVHFHVPVDAERLGPLTTTRSALGEAMEAVAALDYAPHLEVETYTWEVLPGGEKPDLIEGLSREMISTRHLLQHAVQSKPSAQVY